MNKTAKHPPKIIAQAGLLSLTFWMGAVCGSDSRRATPRPVPAVAPLPVFRAPTLPPPAARPIVAELQVEAEIAPPSPPAMAPTEPAAAKAGCQPAGQAQCSYQSCRRGLFRGRR